METFDHLLNWKLKRGSHEFPGSDGGTCINEAALVAAGFAYKQITHVSQMPKCFSRPICHLALRLNDEADDKERQRLLPYVTRLACADTPEVEEARKAYIRRHTGCEYDYDEPGIMPYLSRRRALPFDKGLEVLDRSLAIGRQADPLGVEEIRARMDAARPTPEKPLVSKAKSWLTMKEMEPMA